MSKGFTVDTRKFNALVRDLARNTGRTIPQIIESETKAILERALALTKSAKSGKIRADTNTSEWITLPNKKRAKRAWRLSAKDWAHVQKRNREKLAKLLAARGLSKKQILGVGDQLGMRLSGVPDYVRRAVSTDKDHRNAVNSKATRKRSPFTYAVQFIIKYPLAFFKEVGLASAVNRAIAGRVKFFQRNVKEGVFKSQAAIARAYGARVTTTP
jgi:hypothetical protein